MRITKTLWVSGKPRVLPVFSITKFADGAPAVLFNDVNGKLHIIKVSQRNYMRFLELVKSKYLPLLVFEDSKYNIVKPSEDLLPDLLASFDDIKIIDVETYGRVFIHKPEVRFVCCGRGRNKVIVSWRGTVTRLDEVCAGTYVEARIYAQILVLKKSRYSPTETVLLGLLEPDAIIGNTIIAIVGSAKTKQGRDIFLGISIPKAWSFVKGIEVLTG
jgi:hypothetical protein